MHYLMSHLLLLKGSVTISCTCQAAQIQGVTSQTAEKPDAFRLSYRAGIYIPSILEKRNLRIDADRCTCVFDVVEILGLDR